MANGTDKVPELLHAIELVDSAIALAESALLDNPSKEDERALNRVILRLQAERAVLEAELDAALAGDTAVQGPSPAQLAEIEALSERVEQATRDAVSASGRIALAGRVIDLMTTVISHQ